MLYIVSTPIGNLKDITLRAIETLKNVDVIAAEDTRHTKILTRHYHIETPLTSYFEHNKFKKADVLLQRLTKGEDVALVTDAGTPGISDPGFHLIRLAQEHHIPTTVIPGPCALIAALSLSGLPTDKFMFLGFLPPKTVARKKRLESLKGDQGTVVFYESPYRLLRALKDIMDVLDDPHVAVVREATKKFEELQKGRVSDILARFKEKKPRGEIVLLISL